jgi:hypothetical protein
MTQKLGKKGRFAKVSQRPSAVKRQISYMERYSKKQIKSLLSKLYWDMDINPDELYRLLLGEIDKAGPVLQSNLFYRILTSYDWYTILKLIPSRQFDKLLEDDILNRIHPKDLKEKYLYARHVISE